MTGNTPTVVATRSPSRRAVLAVLAAWNLTLWAGAIGNDFVFDDLVNVLANRWLRDWTALSEAFTAHAAGFNPVYETSFYRPGMHVLYATVFSVAGPRAWAFHLLNVGLHLCNVLCVYVLTEKTVRRWYGGRLSIGLPFVAALVFSLHPVHVEAVSWIAGVTDLSYSLFGLLALIVYADSFCRPRRAFFASALLLVALFCKETAIAFVAVFVLLEWIESRTDSSWSLRSAALRLSPAALAVAVYVVARFHALGSFAPSAAAYPRDLPDLILTGAGLFARYIVLLIVPFPLNVMRSIPAHQGMWDPMVLGGFGLTALFLAAAVRLRRDALGMLALAVSVIPILPVLYVPAIESKGSVFGERYLYLPVVGVGWAVAMVLDRIWIRFPRGRGAVTVALALGALAASAAVIARDRVWNDSLALWTDAVRKSPRNPAAHEGLCFALYERGKFEAALDACSTALSLDPERVDARINRGTALLALGRPIEAKAELELALSMRPNSPEALVNQGLACMVLGEVAQAIAYYRQALSFDPRFAEAHNVLGVALFRMGRTQEALIHLEEAVRLAPENREYLSNLIFCSSELGDR